MWNANKMMFFNFVVRLNFGEKKLRPALFVNDFCSPKVTTPLKLRPPKAANSESNEGRYYRNSTVCILTSQTALQASLRRLIRCKSVC